MPTDVPTNNAANHRESGCLPTGDGKPDSPEAAPQQARRQGAPRRNQNAVRGLRAGFSSQTLPKGCHHIEDATRAMRDRLEVELRESHNGEVPAIYLAALQSAVRHDQLCRLGFKRLRALPASASTDEQMKIWAFISREADARDRALRSLGLGKRPGAIDNPFAFLDDANGQSGAEGGFQGGIGGEEGHDHE